MVRRLDPSFNENACTEVGELIGNFDGEYVIDLNGRMLPYRVDDDEIYSTNDPVAKLIGSYVDGVARLADGTILFKLDEYKPHMLEI